MDSDGTEKPICVKIICPFLRCIFITSLSKWNLILDRCKKFDNKEVLYLEGDFRLSIFDVINAQVVRDKNSLEAYRYLFQHNDWIGLDFMYLIEIGLKILENNEDIPEGDIKDFSSIINPRK